MKVGTQYLEQHIRQRINRYVWVSGELKRPARYRGPSLEGPDKVPGVTGTFFIYSGIVVEHMVTEPC